MGKNLYIATSEAQSGKSVVALGLMELLKGTTGKVAFFRPIIGTENPEERDADIDLILNYFKLKLEYSDSYAYTISQARDMINNGQDEELIDGIINQYKNLEDDYDFILIEGTDYEGVTSAFEFDINSIVANNLGAPVFLVSNGNEKNIHDAVSSLKLSIERFDERGCTVLGGIINRVPVPDIAEIRMALKSDLFFKERIVYAIPENESIAKPTLCEIKKSLSAEVLYGEEQMSRHAHHYLVAAAQLKTFLKYVREGSLVITPGDRADIILGSLVSANSISFPHIMGIVLTGGLKPGKNVRKLIKGLTLSIPILKVDMDTFTTVTKLNQLKVKISANDKRKIETALGVFETNIDLEEIRNKIVESRSKVVTPKMFEHGLIQKARKKKMRIVLPEGTEERILRAAELLMRRNVADLVLLGGEDEIRGKIKKSGLKLENISIIEPMKSEHFEDYVNTYFDLRKHKGITIDIARDRMSDVSYFGSMMVHKGDADGMVSGAVHTTQHTIRPSLEFIKTKPGFSIVSSVFFMCLEDRVLVYGDCAVNPNPNADELAEIALASAETAKVFGVDPKVAMLSYSTGDSGKGEDVEKVRKATEIVHQKSSELKVEGPIQYDAAVDVSVARTKLPESEVAGKATVFIFPDLNTGNNTYKAVQRSANAVAIGPVLQGLNKPVNDLSRGCTVPDIVNTVAITAIQAQVEK